MLAYPSNRPVVGVRGSSPNSMLFIISAHVAAVAVLMSAKWTCRFGSPNRRS